MLIGVPKETFPGEKRVALVPAAVPTLAKAGWKIRIQAGAGSAAGFPDASYAAKGAEIAADRGDLFRAADVLLQVRTAGANPDAGRADLDLIRKGQILIGFADPLSYPESVRDLAARGAVLFAMEFIPRITRAQAMDALSSMATVAGYKAVLLAAEALPKMFPMMTTAAGTLAPARVFVMGAGVAGLQAIATARRLGAVVHAYDVRPAVKEQVESVGGKFVDLPLAPDDAEDRGGYARAMGEDFYRRQREVTARVVAESDVAITTAAIPGQKAPVLITREMAASMAPGSVIVDLAAERGGNCELTRPDETIVAHGVTVIGPTNLPSTVPFHASQMYARNLSALLLHAIKDGRLSENDEIVREAAVTRGGEVVQPRVRDLLGSPAAAKKGGA